MHPVAIGFAVVRAVNTIRSNLQFEVISAATSEEAFDRFTGVIGKTLQTATSAPLRMLVFCSKRATAEEVTQALCSVDQFSRVRIDVYHAGLMQSANDAVVDRFADLSGHPEPLVVVCTSAFATGIDIQCVRLILHYGAPVTLLDYIQGAGRGSRDGHSARCVLIDWPESREHALAVLPKTSRQQYDDFRLVTGFIETSRCRRLVLGQLVDATEPSATLMLKTCVELTLVGSSSANMVQLCDRCQVRQGTHVSSSADRVVIGILR